MSKKNVYDEPGVVVPVSPVVAMTGRDFLRILLGGALVGLVTAAASILMHKFIFEAVLCRPQSVSDCAQAPTYSMLMALIIGAIFGVVYLAQMRVYRPLLVVLASLIALWSLGRYLLDLPWYWSILTAVVLFALSYGLFGWISRIRNFILATVVIVVTIVVVRLMFSA